MTNLILYFGSTDSATADAAKKHSADAFLIDRYNIATMLHKEFPQDTVAYTSLGDLPKDINIILQLLASAKKIVYCPPVDWNKNQIDYLEVTNNTQGFSEFLLFLIDRELHNVENLDLSHYDISRYLALSDVRKTTDPQLWIVGDSNSHAVGVDDRERYGSLLGVMLDKDVSFLTTPGTSIEWAADQILRSNIRKDDIIVWGLTDEARLTFWVDQAPWHVNALSISQRRHNLFDLNTIGKLLTDETRTYQAITHVYQVANFCDKIQAKLFVFGLGISDNSALHLHNLKNFSKYQNRKNSLYWLDFGSDNKHPGPQQHQLFADFCVNQLRHLQYIN